ncbi:MAG: helix-turn-helix domain-containing protein [Alicyclobacillus sp.]|nr:helix-turn-helix domain-containing protein [Alicyclobacillus sp.]
MKPQRDWLVKIRGNRTQEQVAVAAGISRSAYANIENGNREPSVEMAKKIAAVLQFDWTMFFDSERLDSQHTA